MFSSRGGQKTCVCIVSLQTLAIDFHDYIRPQKITLEDDHDHDCDSDDEAGSSAVRYSFPELDAQIRATIDEYGGAVFPKLNFSSPKVRLFILFFKRINEGYSNLNVGCGMAFAYVPLTATMHVPSRRLYTPKVV